MTAMAPMETSPPLFHGTRLFLFVTAVAGEDNGGALTSYPVPLIFPPHYSTLILLTPMDDWMREIHFIEESRLY